MFGYRCLQAGGTHGDLQRGRAEDSSGVEMGWYHLDGVAAATCVIAGRDVAAVIAGGVSPDPCPGALLYLTAVPAQAQLLRARAQQVQAPTGVA